MDKHITYLIRQAYKYIAKKETN